LSLGLSGSTIKNWFQYRCERKTRYEMMPPAELAAVPISEDVKGESWAKFGQDFEKRVVARLGRAQRVHLPGPHEDALADRVADAFLRGEGAADHAAQVNVRPSGRPAFLSVLDGVMLRRNLVDLIRRDQINSTLRFTIIDIKGTRAARAFHKTQIAFYALLLRDLLSERGIAGEVSATGEIWRIPDDGDASSDRHQVEAFALGPYLRLVEEFVRRTLPGIASREVRPGHDDTFFHIYFKCEQCAYLGHCRREIAPERPPNRRDISAVAGLSHESKRTLLANGIRSVGRLAQQGHGLARMDGAGWTLSRRADQLIVRARALAENQILAGIEEQTFLMPPRVDLAVYLLADHDPVDDGLVSLGCLLDDGTEQRAIIEVLDTPSRTAEADALVRVFSTLIAELELVDRHNSELPEDDPAARHAHIFLYEPAEATALQNAVKRHLGDPRVRAGLLHMVRLFPPEDIVPEPEFRGMSHLPATALRSVVEQLFGVPAAVSYDLRQVSQALHAAGLIDRAYQPHQDFERPFSALLSLDVSRNLRERHKGHATADDVRRDARDRLEATRAISGWLRSEHAARLGSGGRPMLRLAKKPFRLQASFDPLNAPDLDILAALELLENRAGMLDTLIRLAKPARARRDAGNALGPLRLIRVYDNQRNKVMLLRRGPEAREAELRSTGLGTVISDGSPESLLDPRGWDEIACELLDAGPTQDPDLVRVRVWNGTFNGPRFQRMMRELPEDGWWIDQTFADVNSAKAASFLNFLSAGQP
jgi:hypothetical protein